MNIYLLRHGETEWNNEGRLQGHTDIPLSQTGKLQIKQAAEVFENLDTNIELIISSPLSRAYESAAIVADRLKYAKDKIIVEPMLMECYFGKGEGLTIAERNEKYPDDIYPEMESFDELIRRAHSVINKILLSCKSNNNILIVAHGAILCAILTAITNGLIVYGGKTVIFDNGSIHLIKYSDEIVELKKYVKDEAKFMDVIYK